MPRHSDKAVIAAIANHIGSEPRNVGYNEKDEAIVLDLSKLDISSLPSEIWELKNLERLDLSNNKLAGLPDDITILSNLIFLDISHNLISRFPSGAIGLPRLRFLHLRDNAISDIPSRIEDLLELYSLHLSYNPISNLPKEVTNLKELQIIDISSTRFPSFPIELARLKNLRILNVRGNEFDNIPTEIGELTHLRMIDLFNNNISALPQDIKNLSELHALNLSINQFQEFPFIITQLTQLERLHMSYNKLTEIPNAIGNLKELVDLDLRKNLISYIPKEIYCLAKLRYLDISDNQMSHIPPEIGDLKELMEFRLSGNLLRDLPNETGSLSSLQILDVQNNHLTQLPMELGKLPELKNLDVQNNPNLLTPPPEIVALGTHDILAYLRQLQENSAIRYEAKLLIVGEGGTGKSSLLRALRGEELDPNLPTTHGIEVDTYKLPHPSKPTLMITLNTWDFGGQQIYHATHQFFLTRRSMYLVVWNARLGAEQGRLYYWLDTIKAIAPDAKIILVATHTDERAPDLNYQAYRAAFPQLVGSVSISSKTADGIDELKHLLAEQAARIPIMGHAWPRAWLEVEKILSIRPEHHIDADKYVNCCNQCGLASDIAHGTLGSYLHDLGKILYFHDDFVLSNLVVLKPNWVTRAISRVLSDEVTRDAKGVLSHSELPRIWSHDDDGRAYERYLYPAFLRLMERFDLSYQIAADEPGAHSSRSLVPQLLPFQPPVNLPAWPEVPPEGQAQVEMVYRMNFVPSGIMSWFIVRTHRYTSNLHWREGVLLEYEGHSARVELIPALRELRIVVWGLQPHNFFTILMKTMDLILSRFEGLDVERSVPCICHWNSRNFAPCPRFYRYEDLIRRMETRRYSVECPESFIDVSVVTMLYGIHVSTDEQVMIDIKKSQDEILAQLGNLQKIDTILEKLGQQSELIVRNFTRQWNLEMHKSETECPNIFCLMPEQRTLFNIKHWVSQPYRMYLLCQHPTAPHIIGDGYVVRKPEEWWVEISPWINHLIKFLKFGVPLGQAIGEVYDQIAFKQMEANINLLEEISKSIPEIVDADYAKYSTLQSYTTQTQQKVGAALRTLHVFLREADASEHWGGLSRTITPDGNILWLCDMHRQPYEPKPLILE